MLPFWDNVIRSIWEPQLAAASRGAEATSLQSLSFSTSGVKRGRRGRCQTDWLGTPVICTDFFRWTPHSVSKILGSPVLAGRQVQGSSARPGVDRCSRLTCPLVWGPLSAISLKSFATKNWSTLAPERETKGLQGVLCSRAPTVVGLRAQDVPSSIERKALQTPVVKLKRQEKIAFDDQAAKLHLRTVTQFPSYAREAPE